MLILSFLIGKSSCLLSINGIHGDLYNPSCLDSHCGMHEHTMWIQGFDHGTSKQINRDNLKKLHLTWSLKEIILITTYFRLMQYVHCFVWPRWESWMNGFNHCVLYSKMMKSPEFNSIPRSVTGFLWGGHECLFLYSHNMINRWIFPTGHRGWWWESYRR